MRVTFKLTLDLDDGEVPRYVAMAIEEDLAEIYENVKCEPVEEP